MSIPDEDIVEITLRGEPSRLDPIIEYFRTYYLVLRERGPSEVEVGSTRRRWHFAFAPNPATPPPKPRRRG